MAPARSGCTRSRRSAPMPSPAELEQVRASAYGAYFALQVFDRTKRGLGVLSGEQEQLDYCAAEALTVANDAVVRYVRPG